MNKIFKIYNKKTNKFKMKNTQTENSTGYAWETNSKLKSSLYNIIYRHHGIFYNTNGRVNQYHVDKHQHDIDEVYSDLEIIEYELVPKRKINLVDYLDKQAKLYDLSVKYGQEFNDLYSYLEKNNLIDEFHWIAYVNNVNDITKREIKKLKTNSKIDLRSRTSIFGAVVAFKSKKDLFVGKMTLTGKVTFFDLKEAIDNVDFSDIENVDDQDN